jgi:putative ABC transport system substrate-binding protein
VRRREFIALLGGAAVGWPLAGSAQTQPKIPRVGYVLSSAPARGTEAFRQGLRELGYVEGQTIVLEIRGAEGRAERIPELVTELVGLKVTGFRDQSRAGPT